MEKAKLWITTVAVVAGLATQSCSDTSSTPAQLTIAEANQPVFALLYIADAKGFFSDLNLQVDYLRFSSSRDALQSVVDGRADVATAYETPVVLQAINDQPIRIISSLHRSDHSTALLARRDQGINVATDLAGKTLAVPFQTSAHFFLEQYLDDLGFDERQISIVDLEPELAAKNLINGTVDAIAVWSPNLLSTALALSEEQYVMFYSDTYMEMSMLVTTADKLMKSREAYYRLLSGIKKAETYIHKHPEQAKGIVFDYLQKRYTAEVLNKTWGEFYPVAEISNTLLSLLDYEARLIAEDSPLSKASPNFRQLLDASMMRQISPLSVTVND